MTTRKYSARSLAVLLMLLIFVDGMIFGAISANDINKGLEILDISTAVNTTSSDLAMLAEPLIDQAFNVHTFYVMASTETMVLLDDNIVPNIGLFVEDIRTFYSVATREMSEALDLSYELSPSPVYAAGY